MTSSLRTKPQPECDRLLETLFHGTGRNYIRLQKGRRGQHACQNRRAAAAAAASSTYADTLRQVNRLRREIRGVFANVELLVLPSVVDPAGFGSTHPRPPLV